MQNKYQIYLWEPETSPHKLPLFNELLSHDRISSVTYIAQEDLNAKRRLEGWQTNINDSLPVLIGPTQAEVEKIISTSPLDSIHIFSGMRWVPCIVDGLRAAISHRRRFGILHEPRVFEGIAGLARLSHSWLTEASLRRHASFILAIGAHGPDWFRLSGYRAERIFPFAYFLNARSSAPANFVVNRSTAPVISFLGRLEKAKGIHLFLDAIDKVHRAASFCVAGHGAYSSLVDRRARSTHSLQYLHTIKMAEVPYFLSETDILVLPSITKDDGWGAVVSEALMAGAAVVCSHKVGASVCLTDPSRGIVTSALTGEGIAAALREIIDAGSWTAPFREPRRQWAAEHLTQRVGVEYLLKILDHVFCGQIRPSSFLA